LETVAKGKRNNKRIRKIRKYLVREENFIFLTIYKYFQCRESAFQNSLRQKSNLNLNVRLARSNPSKNDFILLGAERQISSKCIFSSILILFTLNLYKRLSYRVKTQFMCSFQTVTLFPYKMNLDKTISFSDLQEILTCKKNFITIFECIGTFY
jgi:hypothetical protein